MIPAKPRVSIIGGYGGMGRLFSKMFLTDGFDVVVAGPTEAKGRKAEKELGVKYVRDNREAVAEADLVIITVPIRGTLDVIREVGPAMKGGSCLIDLTSVKAWPCEAMGRAAPKSAEVVGTHPVFGPTVGTFRGQHVVLCKVRGSDWFGWLKKYLEKKGALVTVCTPEEHDKVMGVVQGLSHFMLFSAGKALKDLKVDMKKSREMSSPVYQLILDLVGRLLAQDPSMYCEIQLENRNSAGVRKAFLEAAEELDNIISRGDEDAFVKEAEEAAKHFKDAEGALKRTDDLLKK